MSSYVSGDFLCHQVCMQVNQSEEELIVWVQVRHLLPYYAYVPIMHFARSQPGHESASQGTRFQNDQQTTAMTTDAPNTNLLCKHP